MKHTDTTNARQRPEICTDAHTYVSADKPTTAGVPFSIETVPRITTGWSNDDNCISYSAAKAVLVAETNPTVRISDSTFSY